MHCGAVLRDSIASETCIVATPHGVRCTNQPSTSSQRMHSQNTAVGLLPSAFARSAFRKGPLPSRLLMQQLHNGIGSVSYFHWTLPGSTTITLATSNGPGQIMRRENVLVLFLILKLNRLFVPEEEKKNQVALGY